MGADTQQAANAVVHFGERIRPGKYGYRMLREQYALPNKMPSSRFPREMYSDAMWSVLDWMYEDEDHTQLSDEYCRAQREDALENFDLNLAFFAKLSAELFEEALNEMLRKHKYLRPVHDLASMADEIGIYVMVLDDYRQVYIGQTWNIRKRIRQHWNGVKQFDRLLFGGKSTSVLSIDSFRALDTTRIFAARTIRGEDLETRLVNTFPPDYMLNRVNGGARTLLGGRFLPSEVRQRQLNPLHSQEIETPG